MSVYIDAREEQKQSWALPLRKLGIDAKVGNSLPADFLWQCPTGLVLVERKTWSDFVASLTGGGGVDGDSRLARQLIEGPKGAAVRVLLLEGSMPPYLTAQGKVMPAEHIDDISVSLQWQFGCLIIHSLNNEHTPTRIAAFYRWTQKEEHGSLLRPQPPTPEEKIYMNPAFRKKIAAFMTVPLLGEKGALILAANSESPKQIITATQEDLLKIEGIGKMKARNFVEFWERW